MRLRGMLVVMMLVGLAWQGASAHASSFTVVLSLTPRTMVGAADPVLQAHTRIGATCAASVVYDGGAGKVRLQHASQHVGQTGVVHWSWHQHTAATGGVVSVACTWKGQLQLGSMHFSVTQRAKARPTATATIVSPTATPQPQETNTPTPKKGVATSPDLPGVEVSAKILRIDRGGDFPPPAGQFYVVIRVTIVNNGSANYSANPFNFALQDAGDKVRHNMAFDPGVSNSQLNASTLAPGETVSGDIAFEVPDTEKQVILFWQPSFLTADVPVPLGD